MTNHPHSAGATRYTRRRVYIALMGTCAALVISAWSFVRIFSITAAVIMSVIAALIPPAAAILGSTGDPDDPV